MVQVTDYYYSSMIEYAAVDTMSSNPFILYFGYFPDLHTPQGYIRPPSPHHCCCCDISTTLLLLLCLLLLYCCVCTPSRAYRREISWANFQRAPLAIQDPQDPASGTVRIIFLGQSEKRETKTFVFDFQGPRLGAASGKRQQHQPSHRENVTPHRRQPTQAT